MKIVFEFESQYIILIFLLKTSKAIYLYLLNFMRAQANYFCMFKITYLHMLGKNLSSYFHKKTSEVIHLYIPNCIRAQHIIFCILYITYLHMLGENLSS